ncbi:GntR family transcriptional regulator [Salinispira pacifica]
MNLRSAGFRFDERIPYYLQLKELLQERIDKGDLPPGTRLPSESELGEQFHVSRTVVRQTLQELEYDGLIMKRKGIGTFVAEPKIVESFVQELSGFQEDMEAQDLSTRSDVLRNGLVQPSRRISKMLRTRAGTRVILLERVRYVGDEPIQLVSSYLPRNLCPQLLKQDFSRLSLYRFLEERGLFLARGYRTIEAVRASEREAEYLHIEVGMPMVRIESIGYLEDGTPIEYFQALHRGDKTRFRVELVRHREANGHTGPRNRTAGSLPGIEILSAQETAARGGPA